MAPELMSAHAAVAVEGQPGLGEEKFLAGGDALANDALLPGHTAEASAAHNSHAAAHNGSMCVDASSDNSGKDDCLPNNHSGAHNDTMMCVDNHDTHSGVTDGSDGAGSLSKVAASSAENADSGVVFDDLGDVDMVDSPAPPPPDLTTTTAPPTVSSEGPDLPVPQPVTASGGPDLPMPQPPPPTQPLPRISMTPLATSEATNGDSEGGRGPGATVGGVESPQHGQGNGMEAGMKGLGDAHTHTAGAATSGPWSVFQGTLAHIVRCSECGNTTSRRETFTDLALSFSGPRGVYFWWLWLWLWV